MRRPYHLQQTLGSVLGTQIWLPQGSVSGLEPRPQLVAQGPARESATGEAWAEAGVRGGWLPWACECGEGVESGKDSEGRRKLIFSKSSPCPQPRGPVLRFARAERTAGVGGVSGSALGRPSSCPCLLPAASQGGPPGARSAGCPSHSLPSGPADFSSTPWPAPLCQPPPVSVTVHSSPEPGFLSQREPLSFCHILRGRQPLTAPVTCPPATAPRALEAWPWTPLFLPSDSGSQGLPITDTCLLNLCFQVYLKKTCMSKK